MAPPRLRAPVDLCLCIGVGLLATRRPGTDDVVDDDDDEGDDEVIDLDALAQTSPANVSV